MKYSEAAENALIGQLINKGRDAYIDASDIIRVEHLAPRTALLFNLFQSIFEDHDAPDIASWGTLKTRAEINGCSKELSSCIDYLKDVKRYDLSHKEFIKTCKLITLLGIRRDLHDKHSAAQIALDSLPQDASVEEIIAASEKPIFDYTSGLIRFDDDGGLIGEGAYEFIESLGLNPRTLMGISTGYGIFDQLIGGGAQRGDANIILSRFGKGKSSLGDNIGLHTSKNDIKVLSLDTEMKRERHILRIVSNMTGISMNELKNGSYHRDPFLKTAALDAANELSVLPFYYRVVAGMDFSEIVSYIRKWIVKEVGVNDEGKTNDCLIIYDYFKLADSKSLGKNVAEYQALGFQLMEFINMIIRHDASAICFAQLNRQGDEETTTQAIGASDRIGQYAGSVSFWQEKGNDEKSKDGIQNGNMKMSILKARDGQGTGEDYISYKFEREINRITEVDLGSNLEKKASLKREDDTEIPPL